MLPLPMLWHSIAVTKFFINAIALSLSPKIGEFYSFVVSALALSNVSLSSPFVSQAKKYKSGSVRQYNTPKNALA